MDQFYHSDDGDNSGADTGIFRGEWLTSPHFGRCNFWTFPSLIPRE